MSTTGGPRGDVAVVGGGPAGLAAAWALVSAGAAVTLYEAEPRPGGRMRTDEVDGVRVDPAVQLLGSHYTETRALAESAGAAGLLLPAAGRDAFWRSGRIHPLTYGSPTSMAASGALPLKLKLRLLSRYLPFLLRHRGELDASDPAGELALALDERSIAAWGEREVGRDFVELLAYPLLAAYGNATPEETSAGYYHALSSAGLDVRLFGVKGGVGSLCAALGAALQARGARLRWGVEVERVEQPADGRVRLWCREAGGPGAPTLDADHDAAVVAVPCRTLPGLLDAPPPLAGWLAGVRYRPALSLALLLSRPSGLDFFGLSFPRVEKPGDLLAAVCNLEAKPGGLVPEGRGALVVYPAPALAEALQGEPPATVLDRLLPGLDRVLPGLEARVQRARVYAFPEGSTLVPAGGLRRLSDYDPSWLGDSLALAGDYLGAPTVEGAVRSGLRAARWVLRRLRP